MRDELIQFAITRRQLAIAVSEDMRSMRRRISDINRCLDGSREAIDQSLALLGGASGDTGVPGLAEPERQVLSIAGHFARATEPPQRRAG